MHLWYGIKGTVDKTLSANLEKLKAQGYPFHYQIFTELGHGGLAGEQPERFFEEMRNTHEGTKVICSELFCGTFLFCHLFNQLKKHNFFLSVNFRQIAVQLTAEQQSGAPCFQAVSPPLAPGTNWNAFRWN